MKGPSFSLRDVPWTIYVALAFNLIGTLAMVAVTSAKGNDYESWESLERWFTLSNAMDHIYLVLLPLGFLELAKRQVGTARTLGVTGASLLFIGLCWMALTLGIAIADPKENPRWLFEWFGRLAALAYLAAYLLILFAADAWRRVPIAAVGILLVILTSHSVPVIGPAIADLFKSEGSMAPRFAYSAIRDSLTAASLLFVAGALAARGTVIPAPERAYGGFQLARGALLARLVAAAIFIMFAFAAIKSPGTAKLLLVGAPVVAVITAVLFAIGIVQVASSHVAHMPRVLFILGAACVLWWTFVQVEQITGLIQMLRDSDGYGFSDRLERRLRMFTVVGPIVAAVGMLLCGIAVQTYATRAGHQALGSTAATRIAAFVMLTFAAVVLQSGIVAPTSASGGVMLLLVIAVVNIGALVTFTGLLAQAAYTIERPTNLPRARLL